MPEKLSALFGGTVKYTPKEKRPINSRGLYRWYLSAGRAAEVLREVLPWLVVKREQAELAIRSRQYINRTGVAQPLLREERDKISREISDLKRVEYPRSLHLVGEN